MRIVFMGTPDFAAQILYELKEQHDVVAVYTRPDAVRGRGKTLEASPVKKTALAAGIPVFEPSSLRSDEEVERLRALEPDAVCVAAYGMILPQAVLDIPKHGCLNVHASLLPRYRGAAPIERAILAGEREAGVCIMRMEAGLDTGDYCISRSCEIGDMDCARLTAALADKGALALLSALAEIEQGGPRWTAQDDAAATYADKIAKGELDIDPGEACAVNERRVRASSAAHPSRCIVAGKRVTVLAARLVDDAASVGVDDAAPGSVRFVAKRLFLGCADGVLEITSVKPDGKKEMTAAAFASGVQNIKSGTMVWERN
ncbi:MAG: methionyl-tRNA formyltransferase [Slackia sp.]|nr:methionyl-tRNA formyltransferase [Slackia sp.]